MPLLLDNIWLQFLEQVALENQKYPEASEHPSAYSLAYIKNVKLAGVHPRSILPTNQKEIFIFHWGIYFRLYRTEEQKKVPEILAASETVCKWIGYFKFHCLTAETISV